MNPLYIALLTGPRELWNDFAFESVEKEGNFIGIKVSVFAYANESELTCEHLTQVLKNHLESKTAEFEKDSKGTKVSLEEINKTIDTTQGYIYELSQGAPLELEFYPNCKN